MNLPETVRKALEERAKDLENRLKFEQGQLRSAKDKLDEHERNVASLKLLLSETKQALDD